MAVCSGVSILQLDIEGLEDNCGKQIKAWICIDQFWCDVALIGLRLVFRQTSPDYCTEIENVKGVHPGVEEVVIWPKTEV